MDGNGCQHDKGDGDDRMDDKHESMPGCRVRALGLAFDQDAVLVLLANDFGHIFLMASMASAGLKVWRSPECKKPNLVGWAKCKNRKQIFWLPDLGSNQGPTD